jgi:hypothetical protein
MKKSEPSPDESEIDKWFKALDDGPITTLREMLLRSGPIPTELWPLLERLADLNVVIESTNHLDDAALYAYLQEQLDQPTEDLTGTTGVLHIDVIGGFSEEDMLVYLRYYADESSRASFLRTYPDMPPKETPPFDRDQHMPLPRCEREEAQ